MLPQPGRLRAAFFFGATMPSPWKLIEFVEHYPGGFQRGTQRGVPPEVADKLVTEGYARIVGTIGEQPPALVAPVAPASSEEPHHHRGKPRHERTK